MKLTIGTPDIPDELDAEVLRGIGEELSEKLVEQGHRVLIIAHGMSASRIAQIAQLAIQNQDQFAHPIVIVDSNERIDPEIDQNILHMYPDENKLGMLAPDIFAQDRHKRLEEMTELLVRVEQEAHDRDIVLCAPVRESTGRYPGQSSTKRQWKEQMKRGRGR